MTDGVSLYDAIYRHAQDGEEEGVLVRQCLQRLAENQAHAVGFSFERNRREPIPPDFWRWCLSGLRPADTLQGVSVDDVGDSVIDNRGARPIYGAVTVFEGAYVEGGTAPKQAAPGAKGGRPAKGSWPHLLAEVARLVFVGEIPEGFPHTGQAALVEKLQRYLAENSIPEPLGDDALVKAVRLIYRHCASTE